MGKTGKHALLLTAVVVVIVFAFAATALAATVTNVQSKPGQTTRTIVDKTQVAVYKLPLGVTHTGYMHFELQFKPNWADFDLYLLNSDGDSLAEPEGYLGTFSGKEVVDYKVTNIVNQTIETDPYSGEQHMVGDTYYLVVVAFNERAQFKLWGYYPQVDYSYGLGWDTRNQWNVYYQGFSKGWRYLNGPAYGYPFDFRPTSVGDATVTLDWPLDPTTGQINPTPAFASNWESYVYAGSNWVAVLEDYGHGTNWTPPLADTLHIVEGAPLQSDTNTSRPGMIDHFVPSLYLPSSTTDPVGTPLADGSSVPPRLGITTLWYKATLVYPENLRMSCASSIKRGSSLVFKGTYALNGAWAAPGTKVTINKVTATGLKPVKTVTVGANGKWTVTVYPTKTFTWQASAPGDATTGLAVEKSAPKRVYVHW